MRRLHRLHCVTAGLAVAGVLTVAGCGSSGSGDGVSDSAFVDALGLTTKGGHYVIDKNPFCSVEKLLNDSGEVSEAASSGLVLASKDGAVGIKVITPFAPGCRKDAEKALGKLAKKQR